MLSSKKLDFAAGICLSEAQNPIPSALTHCMCVYQILIHTGKGEGGTLEKTKGHFDSGYFDTGLLFGT